MKKIVMLSLAAVLSLGLLAGCGGGGGGATPSRTVDVEMGPGMAFKPDSIDLKKGETVTLRLINKESAQDHSFVAKDLNVKKAVKAGKTETVNVTAKKDGSFEFLCDVAGHKEGGMHGTITVAK